MISTSESCPAWSTWAAANHEVIALNEVQTDQRTEEVSPTMIAYILGAMQGKCHYHQTRWLHLNFPRIFPKYRVEKEH
jgi:hypothetical protein